MILVLQNLDPNTMTTHPILFGDFMKVGADKEDKMYEDLTNIDKVKQVLGDVCILHFYIPDCQHCYITTPPTVYSCNEYRHGSFMQSCRVENKSIIVNILV